MLRADGDRNVDTPLETVVQHMDYLAGRMGIDHVGLGSDFDGATMPQALRDVSKLPDLIAALRKHGYDERAVRKVTHENWIRVLRQTWHD
jgi:membrane dipeptidase